MRTLAWVGMGVGVAGLAAGGVLFVLAGGAAKNLDADVQTYNNAASRTTAAFDDLQARQRSVARLDVLTLVGFGVGAVALATGAVLYFSGDDPGRYEATTTSGVASRFDWSLGLGVAGILVSGRF